VFDIRSRRLNCSLKLSGDDSRQFSSDAIRLLFAIMLAFVRRVGPAAKRRLGRNSLESHDIIERQLVETARKACSVGDFVELAVWEPKLYNF
jgi:hypothetical protein